MSPAVLGVDPGTKHLGVARTDGGLTTITTRIDASDPVRRLYELDRAFWSEVRTHPPTPAVLVVEGYLLHGPGSISRIRAGEVGGMIRTAGFRLGAHVVEVTPQQLKRFATGNGNADKDAMRASALESASEDSCENTASWLPANHDEADAYHLRRLGRMGVGDLQPTEAHEIEVMAAITWPIIGRGDL